MKKKKQETKTAWRKNADLGPTVHMTMRVPIKLAKEAKEYAEGPAAYFIYLYRFMKGFYETDRGK